MSKKSISVRPQTISNPSPLIWAFEWDVCMWRASWVITTIMWMSTLSPQHAASGAKEDGDGEEDKTHSPQYAAGNCDYYCRQWCDVQDNGGRRWSGFPHLEIHTLNAKVNDPFANNPNSQLRLQYDIIFDGVSPSNLWLQFEMHPKLQ